MSTYQLPPLSARPLPPLPEMTVLLSEDREAVVFDGSGRVLAEAMRVEIEQHFEEVLDR
jgi:hypothetical protein